jgi:hypothetical protein
MNAIILDPEAKAWLSSSISVTPVLNADTSVGWKTEAERLAWRAKHRERELRQ